MPSWFTWYLYPLPHIADYVPSLHTIVICGKGQVLLVVVNVLSSGQDSIITQLVKLLHHPQSSINVFDTDKHDEQPPAKAEHLYSITINEKLIFIKRVYSSLNVVNITHYSDGQHQSPDHTLHLVQSTL